MEDILKRQADHLASIESLLRTDRIMQVAQTMSSRRMVSDEDRIVDELADIHETLKTIADRNTSTANVISRSRDLANQDNPNSISNKHLEALQKIQKTLSKQNEYKKISERALKEPIFKSFSDNFRDIKTSFKALGSTLTSGNLLSKAAKGIASTLSPRYNDKLKYIQNERNLGNTASEKILSKHYEQRSQLLQRNVANEEMLHDKRGSLTKEEFLKGDSVDAKKYKKERAAVGRGLKKVDSRYSIDEKVAKRERNASEKLSSKFRESVGSISDTTNQQVRAIDPLVNSNLVNPPSREDTIEGARSTKTYQDTQLKNSEKQIGILTDQLVVQKDILEILKKLKANESSESSVPSVLDNLTDLLPKGKTKRARTKANKKRTQRARTRTQRASQRIARTTPNDTPAGTREQRTIRRLARATPRTTAADITPRTTAADIVPEARTTPRVSNGEGLISKTKTAITEGTAAIVEKGKSSIKSLGETALGKKALGASVEVLTPAINKTIGASRKVLSVLEKIPGLGTILTAADIYMRIDELDNQVKDGTLSEDDYKKEVTKAIGAALGTTGGAIAGGALGSVVGPIGTIAGGIAGAIGGEHVGSYIAEKLFDAVENGKDVSVDSTAIEKTNVNQTTAENGNSTDASAVPPEKGRVDGITPSNNASAVTPSVVSPKTASEVYAKSSDMVNKETPSPASVNNVNANTTNVSTSTSKTIMKNETRNNESSVGKLFANRLQFQ